MVLTLVSFALSPTALAVSPPPDGGYANFNTAEGDDAIFSLTTGSYNTAIGFQTLYFNTTGGGNAPPVLRRCISTQPAAATRPPVMKRS
jgi:hypothetical protein